MYQKTTD